MCTDGLSAAYLTHLNKLLTLLGGICVVGACTAWRCAGAEALAEEGRWGLRVLALLPAPLLALAHLAAAALRAPPHAARALLLLYCVCGAVVCAAWVSAGAGALAALAGWLADDGWRGEQPDTAALRALARPLVPLLAPAAHLPDLYTEEVRVEAMVCLVATAAVPALLAVCAVLAACARPRPEPRRSSHRRCNSMYYVSSSDPPTYKMPLGLGNPDVWQ